MSTADYERGYNEGFSKGFAQARKQYETHIKTLKVQLEQANNRARALVQLLPSTARTHWQFCDVCTSPNTCLAFKRCSKALAAYVRGVSDVCGVSNAARRCPECGRPEQQCTCAREWFV